MLKILKEQTNKTYNVLYFRYYVYIKSMGESHYDSPLPQRNVNCSLKQGIQRPGKRVLCVGYLSVQNSCYPPQPLCNPSISQTEPPNILVQNNSRLLQNDPFLYQCDCVFLKNLGLESLPMFPFRTMNSAPPQGVCLW